MSPRKESIQAREEKRLKKGSIKAREEKRHRADLWSGRDVSEHFATALFIIAFVIWCFPIYYLWPVDAWSHQ